jgi:hypothetical protein
MSALLTSELVPVADKIAPQSVAAAANATSGWIDAGQAPNFVVNAQLGALGGGTVTLSIEQASDNTGTGAKAAAGPGTPSSAANNATLTTNVRPEQLDQANGFRYFRAKLANVGGTGALVSAVIQSGGPRYIG